MSLQILSENLSNRLRDNLPGYDAQLSLLNDDNKKKYKERLDSHFKTKSLDDARKSSVMILLYEKDNRIYFPLIVRPQYDGVHSGQIALPGGKMDPEDVDFYATAIREVEEEIGVEKNNIEILGTLSQVYIPPSHFLVDVVIGRTLVMPEFKTDPYEVDSLIEFPFDELPHLPVEERFVGQASSWKMNAPGYVYKEHFIWGATAMMLSELREMLK